MTDFGKRVNAAAENLYNGHPRAVGEIIDLYQKKIYNLAIRYIGDPTEAYDLSQEIFMRLFSKIHLFTPNTNFHSWFMRLAVNTAINYYRKIKKKPATFEFSKFEGIQMDGKATTPLEQEHLNHQINSLLQKLSERERMVITLQTWENRQVKEIAKIMGISIKAVEGLLSRGRRRLRKFISSEGL